MTEISVKPTSFSRDFKAPMKLVYEAWTQAEHLCHWQTPNAQVKCIYTTADIRAGGSALHKMVMPNGNEMWLLTEYKELSPYHTIVFVQHSSNERGEILPPPMPNWPKEILATIKLSESAGVTNMQFIWQPLNPTADEAEAWEASRPNHENGWGGSFEQLANYLGNC